MEDKTIKFVGYNLNLKYLVSDKSVRVLIDTSKDQYDIIKEIPTLPEGLYEVIIKPIIE